MRMQRKNFTLFELLISIGLLVILSVVLLRTLLLTGDFWSAGDEQARLYADAKTALSIISEDLDNIFYQNTSANSPAGATDITAPLWLEAVAYPSSPEKIRSYMSYQKQGVDTTIGDYGAALHMITRTGWGRSSSAKSDLCEVSYYFVPPTQSGDDWSSLYSGDGTLVRGCVDDSATGYNFTGRTASTGMDSIFAPTGSDLKTLITGVLDFRVYAYQKKTDWDTQQYPADLVSKSGDQVVVAEVNEHGIGQTNLEGAVDIETIQIILTLMPPKRINELRSICLREKNASGAAKAEITREREAFVFKYARTFRKTVRIRNTVSED